MQGNQDPVAGIHVIKQKMNILLEEHAPYHSPLNEVTEV